MSKARKANPTVTFIDEYCRLYQDGVPVASGQESTLGIYHREYACSLSALQAVLDHWKHREKKTAQTLSTVGTHVHALALQAASSSYR